MQDISERLHVVLHIISAYRNIKEGVKLLTTDLRSILGDKVIYQGYKGYGKDIIVDLISFLILEHNFNDTILVEGDQQSLKLVFYKKNSFVGKSLLYHEDDFLSQYCNTNVLTYENNYGAIINRKNGLALKNIYLFLSCIPRILPNLVDVKNMSDLDKDILSDIAQCKPDDALKKINEWLVSQNFQKKILKSTLEEYVNSSIKKDIERHKENILRTRQEVADLESTISDLLVTLESREKFIEDENLLLVNSKNCYHKEEVESLIDFIESINGLHVSKQSQESSLTISIRHPLDCVDLSLLEYALNNDRHSIFDYADNKSGAQKLFGAIWRDKTAQLYVNCVFKLDGLVTSVGQKNLNYWQNDKNSIQHPHIVTYKCIGGFRESFVEIAREGDIYTAIMTMIASCSSLNLADPIVCNDLSNQLFNPNYYGYSVTPILYKGQYYSINDMINILEGEN